ncbi:hypothetical protein ACFVTE_11655 [Arthrobacter sp. NPDC058097]|uniref:hypothetical protein n=1 Tax=Arthrobacter sp. NPDC058097 TaxID=3346340 RepID=UPI0036DED935
MTQIQNTEVFPTLKQNPVDGACLQCGAHELWSYPVMAESGWQDVVKCRNCLHSASREVGNRLGPVTLLVDLL